MREEPEQLTVIPKKFQGLSAGPTGRKPAPDPEQVPGRHLTERFDDVQSFKTTNCIEGVHKQLARFTDRVDRWRSSDQRRRWVASALLEIEPGLNRVWGHEHLKELRMAMKKLVVKQKQENCSLRAYAGISTNFGLAPFPSEESHSRRKCGGQAAVRLDSSTSMCVKYWARLSP